MKKYYLMDYDHGKLAVRQDRILRTASQIVLKYGATGVNRLGYSDERVREFWDYDDDIPTYLYFKKHIKHPNVKWYIHNKIKTENTIWSADFLHGLMAHCKVIWNKRCFPSCQWNNNTEITELLQNCPYGGRIVKPENLARHRWVNVPALYLKFDDTSISFVAGLMSGLKMVQWRGNSYAMFYKRALPYFEKLGIPIEFTCGQDAYMISPFWPALFVEHMPSEMYHKWTEAKKPYNADVYAAILWKTYIDNNFVGSRIPYLKGRRSIYYDFENEEGAMKNLERLRVEKKLTELDDRIKNVIKEWSENERD